MTLNVLAKELQDDLVNGVLNFIIYKQNRKWYFELFDSYEDDKNEDEELKLENIRNSIDDNAMVVNGNNDFANYTLQYIAWQINRLYKR